MDQDLPGDKRVEAVTWALFDNSEELGPIMLAYEGEDAGMVMLELMRHRPTAVSDDFLHWLNGRSRFAWKIISGFFDPIINDTLKEAYLEFINRLAEDVGAYDILYTTLTIKKVDP